MVNFGKYLERIVHVEYKDYYIPYNNLKTILDDAINGKLGAHENFCRSLESAHVKCLNFAKSLINKVTSSSSDSRDILKENMSQLILINSFIFVNQEALRKIIKKHDKNLSSQRLLILWKWKMDFGLSNKIIESLIDYSGKLSSMDNNDSPGDADIISAYNSQAKLEIQKKTAHSGGDLNIAELHKQEDSFVRQSTKYWVHNENVASFLSSVLEHLQVDIYKSKSSNDTSNSTNNANVASNKNEEDENKGEDEDDKPWSLIQSVYFDNIEKLLY